MGTRNVHNKMRHYRSESGSDTFEMGHAHSSRSNNPVNRIREGYRTGRRNNGNGMEEGYGSRSDVGYNRFPGNGGHDISDSKNAVHRVIEALEKLENIDHENAGGYDSREKDEAKGLRDGFESRSRSVAKGMKRFYINR